MTRYRVRIYASPGRKLVHLRLFMARDVTDASVTAARIAAYIRHRKCISAYRMSMAVDELRMDSVRWVTVMTA